MMLNVITGPPSSGKTTLLRCLRTMGFRVVPEAARIVIHKLIRQGEEISETSLEMQQRILLHQMRKERLLSAGRVIFLDRAVPDPLSYIRLIDPGFDILPSVQYVSQYANVFFMGQLPIVDDGIRETDAERVQAISDQIRKTYTDLGVRLIDVPSFLADPVEISVARRIQFIFNYIFR